MVLVLVLVLLLLLLSEGTAELPPAAECGGRGVAEGRSLRLRGDSSGKSVRSWPAFTSMYHTGIRLR